MAIALITLLVYTIIDQRSAEFTLVNKQRTQQQYEAFLFLKITWYHGKNEETEWGVGGTNLLTRAGLEASGKQFRRVVYVR